MSTANRPDRAARLAAVLKEVRRMTAQSVLIGESVSRRFGLSSTDLECLDLAQLSGGATAGEIARATGLTTGAITGVIDRLEQAGYVRREKDPHDRRKVVVRALPAMTRKIAPVYDSLQREMTRLWSRYDDQQLELILDFLSRSCDLAVEEIAKLQAGGSVARRTRPRTARGLAANITAGPPARRQRR